MRNLFLRLALILSIVTIIWGVTSAKLVFLSFEDPQDIYETGFDIVEEEDGGHIKTEIFASYGDCASETLTTTKNGSVTSRSTDYYYIIPAYDKNDNEYYICLKVDEDERSLMNRITNETWDYLEGTIDYVGSNIYEFEGTINELDDEIYDYMLEWFREAEAFDNETELRAHVLPLCLESMNFDGASMRIIVFVVLLALSILFWVLLFAKRSKNKTANATAAAANGMYGASYNGATLNGVPVTNADPYSTQYNANNANGYNANYNYNQNGYDANAYNAAGYNNAGYGAVPNAGVETITIKGVAYPKASLDQVNSYVITGATVQAIKEFRELSGLGLAEAKDIIDNWGQYYR